MPRTPAAAPPVALMRRRLGLAAAVAALLLAAMFAAHIGYFGNSPVVRSIPATATAAAAHQGTVAVLLSGDMGFNVGMAPRLAARLAANGIPVVGVDSLAYFRQLRTPASAARMIEAVTARALARPGARRVVLIGQSFGADQLQAALGSFPAALRHRIALVVLVVPLDTIAYRASPGEIFSAGVDEVSSLPTARRLTWVPLLCVHGAEERDSLCPWLSMPNVERVALPGGHALHRDVERVFAVIMSAIDRETTR